MTPPGSKHHWMHTENNVGTRVVCKNNGVGVRVRPRERVQRCIEVVHCPGAGQQALDCLPERHLRHRKQAGMCSAHTHLHIDHTAGWTIAQ